MQGLAFGFGMMVHREILCLYDVVVNSHGQD